MSLVLTQERLKELLTYDPLTGVFCWRPRRGCKIDKCGRIDKDGYLLIGVEGKGYRAHRLAFLYMTGEWPGPEVDHLNRVRNDNRWVNLKSSNRLENARNRGPDRKNPTGVKGVSISEGAFLVKLYWNRKHYYGGKFERLEEASEVANRFYEDPEKFITERKTI